MSAGGPRPKQLAFISEKEQFVGGRVKKLQRKDAGDRKSAQPPNHPQLRPSPVPSAAGSVDQESDSTAINGHAGTDDQPFSPARNYMTLKMSRLGKLPPNTQTKDSVKNATSSNVTPIPRTKTIASKPNVQHDFFQ